MKRARDYGIVIGDMETGKHNHIVDIPGLRIGHVTLNNDEKGCARTGVTAILPHSNNIYLNNCAAASYVHNGYGKSIGLPQIEELGYLETPIMLTNTLNVGKVADGLIEYMLQENPNLRSVNSVVCECNDGSLNEIEKRFVEQKDALQALNEANESDTREGNIGGGTGMIAFGYKGGIGSSSRKLTVDSEEYIVAALVQANFGRRDLLRIDGLPIGKMLERAEVDNTGDGSIIIIIATNAPLDARQLKRLAKRAAMGLARTGSVATDGSGDFVLAFSTGNIRNRNSSGIKSMPLLMDIGNTFFPFLKATVETTEEAIINALFAAEDMIGRDGKEIKAINKEQVREMMSSYNYEFR